MNNEFDEEFKREVSGGLLIFGVVIALPLLLIFLTRHQWAPLLVTFIPPSYDEKVGDFIGEIYLEKRLNELRLLEPLHVLVDPVVRPNELESPFLFKVHLLDSSVVNAIALPGGYIFVTTGLIDQADDPEEILGVIGHEIAHVVYRHSISH